MGEVEGVGPLVITLENHSPGHRTKTIVWSKFVIFEFQANKLGGREIVCPSTMFNY
jgi:hypothetical protein